jgi:hypothetical protein
MKVLEQQFVELFPHILDYDHMVPENKFKVIKNILYLYLEGRLLSVMINKEITQVSFT